MPKQLRARGNRQNRLEFNDLIWRGRWFLNRLQRADAEKARELFDQALALEPDSPEALIQATYCLGWTIWASRGSRDRDQGDAPAGASRHRRRPTTAAATCWPASPRCGFARPTGRGRCCSRAVALNPSLAQAHAQLALPVNLSAEPAAGDRAAAHGASAQPQRHPAFFIVGELAMASLACWGSWDEAVVYADQSLIRRPAYWYAAVVKINALVATATYLGQARRSLDELMARESRLRGGATWTGCRSSTSAGTSSSPRACPRSSRAVAAAAVWSGCVPERLGIGGCWECSS